MLQIILRAIRFFYNVVISTLRWAVVVLFMLFAATSLLWGAWLAVLPSVLVVIGAGRKRGGMLALGLIATVLVSPLTIRAVDAEFQRLDAKIEGGGPAALSRLELAEIFAGNLSMAVVGCAVTFCEAAAETALMAIPWMPEDVMIDSAFPWTASPWIRKEIRAHSAAARHGGAKIPPKGLLLYWRGANYDLATEGRAIMALGGGRLEVTPQRGIGEGRELAFAAIVPVTYRPAYTPIFDIGWLKLTLLDTVFWAAQERGWLHPYKLTYRFSVVVSEGGEVRQICPGSC